MIQIIIYNSFRKYILFINLLQCIFNRVSSNLASMNELCLNSRNLFYPLGIVSKFHNQVTFPLFYLSSNNEVITIFICYANKNSVFDINPAYSCSSFYSIAMSLDIISCDPKKKTGYFLFILFVMFLKCIPH